MGCPICSILSIQYPYLTPEQQLTPQMEAKLSEECQRVVDAVKLARTKLIVIRDRGIDISNAEGLLKKAKSPLRDRNYELAKDYVNLCMDEIEQIERYKSSQEEKSLLEDQLNELKEELEKKHNLVEGYLDRLQRLGADFANYKRWHEIDKTEAIKVSNEQLFLNFLEVIDNFERAFDAGKGSGDEEGLREGFEKILKHFLMVLEREGVERIEPEDDLFDPYVHEAVEHEESDKYTDSMVIEILRKGYRYGDKVIRPVQVKVGRPKDEN